MKKNLFLSLITLLLAGCSYTFEMVKDKPLAVVGDSSPVTIEDVEEYFYESHQGHETLLAGEGALNQYMKSVVDRKLMLMEAYRVGYGEDKEIQEFINEKAVKRAYEELYKEEIDQKITVADDEIKDAFAKDGNIFVVHIITTYTKAEIEKVLDRLNKGEDFRDVAAEISIDPSAKKGGRLPGFTWSRFHAKIAEALLSMKLGDVSAPMLIGDKWGIIKLMDQGELETKPDIKEVQSKIEASLRSRKKEKRLDEFFEELKNKWKPEINYDVITRENVLKGSYDEDKESDVVLVKYDGSEIRLKEFRKKLKLDYLVTFPDEYALRTVTNILEDDLYFVLGKKEAVSRGYPMKPEIQEEMQKIRRKLIYEKFVNEMVFVKLDVAEEEVKEYYESNKGKYVETEAVFISDILVSDEEKAKGIMKRLEAGEDFAAIARAESEAEESPQYGGEVGWVHKGEPAPDVEKVLFSISEGGFGMLFYGGKFHVIKVERTMAPRQKTFEEVREGIKTTLFRKKATDTLNKWTDRLRELYPVVLNERNIRAVTKYYQGVVKEKTEKYSSGSKSDDFKKKHGFEE